MRARAAIESALVLNGALDPEATLKEGKARNSLTYFNLMLGELLGDAIGSELQEKEVSAAATVQSGYAYQVDTTGGAFNLTLPAQPKEGMSFSVADAQRNFSTANLGLLPNGRLLEGVRSTMILSANNDNRTWFFRRDTGNWERVRDLELNDDIWLPDALRQSVVWMLAHRLAMSFGTPIDANLTSLAAQGHATIARRYGRRGRAQSHPPKSIASPAAAKRIPVA